MDTFRVTATGLNLREEPKLTGKVIGGMARDEIVERISVSGDGYWFKVKRADGTAGWASHKYLQQCIGEGSKEEFPWMPIALAEVGTKEFTGTGDNPRVVEYLHSTTLKPRDASNDETAWCSAFVNWCIEKAGYAGTDSAWAKSWLNWGKSVTKPRRGCIVVLKREEKKGHVGFFISESATQIKMLGGNQSDQVCIKGYPKSDLLGYRVPK